MPEEVVHETVCLKKATAIRNIFFPPQTFSCTDLF
jgi:hypothetical protein